MLFRSILDQFRANPVAFLDHAWQREHPEWPLPIGKVSSIKVNARDIVAKVQFAQRPKSHPATSEWMPDLLLSLYREGIMRGWSIGFIPILARSATQADREKYGDGCCRVILRWLMLELSAVALPANQEALTVAVAKGVLKASAKRLFEPMEKRIHFLIELPAGRKEKTVIFI